MGKEVSSRFQKKHLLTIEELSQREIRFLLDTAKSFQKAIQTQSPIDPLLHGKTIVNLFFENSTRTRSSFELAIRKLGGSVLNFASSSSSQSKGETLLDTVKVIQAMSPDCLVVRHESAGSPLTLSKNIDVPIVNAGDGFHAHPTQALLDAFTIEEKKGSLEGKQVLIIGDIAHSRVARSNIELLNKMGAKVTVCGPPTLLPPQPSSLGVDFCYRPEEVLSKMDVVMALRIQFERHSRGQLPTQGEFVRFWGINETRANMMKSDAVILHPGPVNRGVEISPEVADSARSVILDQVTNGIVVRMAVLAAVCNSHGLSQWLEKAK